MSDDDKLLAEETTESPQKRGKRKAGQWNEKPQKKAKLRTNNARSDLYCYDCGVSFSRKDSMTRHMKNKHL